MTVFASLWWFFGVRPEGHPTLLTYAVPLAVAGGLVAVVAWRGQTSAQDPAPKAEAARRSRLVGIASGVEGAAIFATAVVLGNLGMDAYLAPAIAIIVGLHFVPLARGLPARLYYGTAALLVLVGAAGAALPDPDMRRTLVSAGAAVILWVTSGLVVLRASTLRGARFSRRRSGGA